MKVTFTESDRNKVLASIKAAMAGRKLGDIVQFGLRTGMLEVTISKLGTSTLQFSEQAAKSGLEYSLTSEKIAFTHRAFKDEVTAKIVKVIEQAGGVVS